MITRSASYGVGRNRAATVSFAEIEEAARALMAAGEYASVAAVRKRLTRGSTSTIAEAMRRFWKDQAALTAGNPVALTRLPPEFADAAVSLWEQALRLSLQTAKVDENQAREALHVLKRDTEARARSLELREKEWDLAARIRERALTDAREQINGLLKELSLDRAELRSRNVRIAELEDLMEDHRRQISALITRAVGKTRAARETRTATGRRATSKRKTPKKAQARGSKTRTRRPTLRNQKLRLPQRR